MSNFKSQWQQSVIVAYLSIIFQWVPKLALLALLIMVYAAPSMAAAPTFCWNDSYPRGAGKLMNCASGLEKNGLICYPKCRPGYAGSGPVCWQQCPSGQGMTDDGAFCYKGAHQSYGNGFGYPWEYGDKAFREAGMRARCTAAHPNKGCWVSGFIAYPQCKAGFHSIGPLICSKNCPAGMGTDIGISCTKKTYGRGAGKGVGSVCDPGYEKNGLLCYKKCKPGYKGVGPVCWAKAPPKWVNCGMGSADNSADCASAIFSQVQSVGQLAMNIVSLGSSKLIAEAADVGAKQAVKNAAKKVKNDITKKFDQVKDDFTKVIRREGSKKVTKAKGLGKDAGKAGLKVGDLTSKGFGIDKAIKKAEKTKLPADQIRAAAEIAAYLDPTGVADVVAKFSHPKCSDIFDMTAVINADRMAATNLLPGEPDWVPVANDSAFAAPTISNDDGIVTVSGAVEGGSTQTIRVLSYPIAKLDFYKYDSRVSDPGKSAKIAEFDRSKSIFNLNNDKSSLIAEVNQRGRHLTPYVNVLAQKTYPGWHSMAGLTYSIDRKKSDGHYKAIIPGPSTKPYPGYQYLQANVSNHRVVLTGALKLLSLNSKNKQSALKTIYKVILGVKWSNAYAEKLKSSSALNLNGPKNIVVSAEVNGRLIATIPKSLAPKQRLIFNAVIGKPTANDSDTGFNPLRVDVYPSGAIYLSFPPGIAILGLNGVNNPKTPMNGWDPFVSLSGLSWHHGNDGISPSLKNGWKNYGGAFGHVTASNDKGFVTLQGLVSPGDQSKAITVLPDKYRPAKEYIFSTVKDDGRYSDGTVRNGTARINVSPDGRVTISDKKALNWVSLAGITFPTKAKYETLIKAGIARRKAWDFRPAGDPLMKPTLTLTDNILNVSGVVELRKGRNFYNDTQKYHNPENYRVLGLLPSLVKQSQVSADLTIQDVAMPRDYLAAIPVGAGLLKPYKIFIDDRDYAQGRMLMLGDYPSSGYLPNLLPNGVAKLTIAGINIPVEPGHPLPYRNGWQVPQGKNGQSHHAVSGGEFYGDADYKAPPLSATQEQDMVVLAGEAEGKNMGLVATLDPSVAPRENLMFNAGGGHIVTISPSGFIRVKSNVMRLTKTDKKFILDFGGITYTTEPGVLLGLDAGWKNYASGYAKASVHRVGPLVVLSGIIKAGKKDVPLTILPSGYRPAKPLDVVVDTYENYAVFHIAANGEVTWVGGDDSSWFSMARISFPANSDVAKPQPVIASFSDRDHVKAQFMGPTFTREGDIINVVGRVENKDINKGLGMTPSGLIPFRTHLYSTYHSGSKANHEKASTIQVAYGGLVSMLGTSNDTQDINLSGINYSTKLGSPIISNGTAGWQPEMSDVPFATRTGTMILLSGRIRIGNGKYGKIGTLPAGFSPLKKEMFQVSANGSTARIDLYPNGDIVLKAAQNFPLPQINANGRGAMQYQDKISLSGIIYNQKPGFPIGLNKIWAPYSTWKPNPKKSGESTSALSKNIERGDYAEPGIRRQGNIVTLSGMVVRTGFLAAKPIDASQIDASLSPSAQQQLFIKRKHQAPDAALEASEYIGTLPIGFRPAKELRFNTLIHGDNAATIGVSILPDGRIKTLGNATRHNGKLTIKVNNLDFVSLSGIAFPAKPFIQPSPLLLTHAGSSSSSSSSSSSIPTISRMGNIVVLNGFINNPVSKLLGTVPKGLEPKETTRFRTSNGVRLWMIEVTKNGQIRRIGGAANTAMVNLSGISYPLNNKTTANIAFIPPSPLLAHAGNPSSAPLTYTRNGDKITLHGFIHNNKGKDSNNKYDKSLGTVDFPPIKDVTFKAKSRNSTYGIKVTTRGDIVRTYGAVNTGKINLTGLSYRIKHYTLSELQLESPFSSVDNSKLPTAVVSNGLVFLNGRIKGELLQNSNGFKRIARLPVGYRPLQDQTVTVRSKYRLLDNDNTSAHVAFRELDLPVTLSKDGYISVLNQKKIDTFDSKRRPMITKYKWIDFSGIVLNQTSTGAGYIDLTVDWKQVEGRKLHAYLDGNRVVLTGSLGASNYGVIGTLPKGYAPAHKLTFDISTNGSLDALSIYPDGTIAYEAGKQSGTIFDLHNIIYKAK